MKKTMRVIAVVLVLISVLSTPAHAETIEPRASDYIFSYFAQILPQGDGEIKIDFTITATGEMSQLGATLIEVYDANGGCVKTFRRINYSNMIEYNTFYMRSNLTYYGTAGTQYYAKITFYAKNSNGYDSKTYYTQTKTA